MPRGRGRGRGQRRFTPMGRLQRQVATLKQELRDTNMGRFFQKVKLHTYATI